MAHISLDAPAELIPTAGYHSICALPLTPISHCASLPSFTHTLLWWYYYAIICLMQQLTVPWLQSSQQITKPPIFKWHNSNCSTLSSLFDFFSTFFSVISLDKKNAAEREERNSTELVKSNKLNTGWHSVCVHVWGVWQWYLLWIQSQSLCGLQLTQRNTCSLKDCSLSAGQTHELQGLA